MSKKLVVKLLIEGEKDKRKALKVVAGHHGVEFLNMDLKDKKLTVTGDFDTLKVVIKLRKSWPHAEIISLGPAKEEPEKKKEVQKQKAEPVRIYRMNDFPFHPYMPLQYRANSIEEDPNSCVIS